MGVVRRVNYINRGCGDRKMTVPASTVPRRAAPSGDRRKIRMWHYEAPIKPRYQSPSHGRPAVNVDENLHVGMPAGHKNHQENTKEQSASDTRAKDFNVGHFDPYPSHRLSMPLTNNRKLRSHISVSW